MRTVGVEEILDVPFVRHQLEPALVRGAWRCGDATVVHVDRRVAEGTVAVVTGFGGRGLRSLLAGVAERVEIPQRVMVTAPPTAVPEQWPLAEARRWHWMLTSRRPPDPTVEVEVVTDHDEVAALLDVVAPGSLARPGTPGIEAWLGIRDGQRLVAVGGVLRQPDGTGHVRAVSVAASHRGRGLGRDLSRAVTRAAMAETGLCSLGVYVDNDPALRIYRDLGYRVVHTFTSGSVTDRSITTAVVPSR